MRPTKLVSTSPITVCRQVECMSARCDRRIVLADAVAFPAFINGQVTMTFFCSKLCYLQAIPPHQCLRA
jgi:hypothetical protein